MFRADAQEYGNVLYGLQQARIPRRDSREVLNCGGCLNWKYGERRGTV